MSTPTKMRGPLIAIVVLAVMAIFLVGRSRRGAEAPAAPTLTGPELLQHAADSFATLRSLYFTLAAQPPVPGLRFGAVSQGDGTVIWPDRLVFRGTIQSTPTLAAPVVIAMCGADRYVELGDGNFMRLDALPNVHQLLFAPDTGLVSGVLTQLQQVSAPEAATLNGTPMWRVAGTVADAMLATLPGRTAPAAGSLRADLWIGQQDLRLHQATLNGPMFDGDVAATVRTLVFSRFNDSLPLTVPRGANPCRTDADTGASAAGPAS